MTFRRAATRYLDEHHHKRSIARDATSLELVDPYIGALLLPQVHAGTLERFIADRRKAGVRSSTVARDLAVVRRVLTLSARLWRDDETGEPWLLTVPLLPIPDWGDRAEAYPLSREEQARLFAELPDHLARAALFVANTGLRDAELRALRWSWERRIPELGASAFVLPASATKGGRERLVPLNRVARSVIEECRGQHRTHVFVAPVGKELRPYASAIGNTAWRKARERAELPQVRVHDLRHTFGRRLRAAGVSLETRAALLGHHRGDITTHYSAAEIAELLEAVELIAGDGPSGPTLTVLRAVE